MNTTLHSKLLVLLVLLLSGAVLAQAPQGKIVCIGDSITWGEGVKEEEKFVSLLAKKSDAVTTVNQGRSGWATSTYLDKLSEVTAAIPPDASILLVQLGANDLRIDGHTDEMVKRVVGRMDRLTDEFHKKVPKAAIVLMSPINMFPKDLSERLKKAGFGEKSPEYLAKIRDGYRELARKKGYRFIDLYEAVSPSNTIDGVHPNAAGQREMAEAIWKGLNAAPPARGNAVVPSEAVEFRPRAGLPNFLAKAQAGGDFRVAYFGGSITAQPGWRVQTLAWMNQTWPKSHFSEINAAIGGTGSDLGVFRFRRDVLDQKPDLLFVEFAVNDGGASPESIVRCMEGIVRQAWRDNPSMDICFVYTLVDGWAKELEGGHFNRSASVMEQVADHYGIPTIHMGLGAVQLARENKLVWRAKEKEQEGKTVFSGDGVHPYPETGHKLYTEAVVRSFEKMRDLGQPAPHALPAPLDPNNYEKAKLVPIAAAFADSAPMDESKGLAKDYRKYMPGLLPARPGQSVTLRFHGTCLGFMDMLGPDCGVLETTLDGGKPRDVNRIDAYCTYHRIGSFFPARDLPDADHTVTVKVTDKPLDKAAILAKNGNTIDNPQRYAATNWYVAWIMVVGDLNDAAPAH